MAKNQINIFWFRRDLRLDDNKGFYEALSGDLPVLSIFIFDRHILDKLEDKEDARLNFIHTELTNMHQELREKGSGLASFYGYPEEIWIKIFAQYNVHSVFVNNDYEPYAKERDQKIKHLCESRKIEFRGFKDHVIFEPDEILKDDGTPYKVFTPFSKRWRERLTEDHLASVPSALYFSNFHPSDGEDIIPLEKMGFKASTIEIPASTVTEKTIEQYGDLRNFPAKNGTSRIGVHLRFGTVSIRKLAQQSKDQSFAYLNELIWREFYQMILWHFPHVVDRNFNKKYDVVEWRTDEEEFNRWCEGKTGYPIVDAGMRELNATGYMHNRVRMIVASFLTKHLFHDWRLGEAYFAKKLLDFELASNNGGWQWAAGTGTDAQPYFRIFNPESQTKKFDPDLKYIRKWVPEFQELDYPKPIIEHKKARERCLDRFKEALS
ncbi:MAG: deoxyribodipyrimidine photo-lyase [Bacteroidota bacterium]